MTTSLSTRALAFAFIAPAAALLPVVMPTQPRALSHADATALHASFDPSLGSLRGGRVDAPASFATHERAELAAAQQRNGSLAAMRGGVAPSDSEWGWIAVGALIVLAIVLI